MNFKMPIKFQFTFWLGMEVDVWDNENNKIAFIKQKLWDFREHTSIFSDSSQTNKLYEIKADRIIDWSAKYHVTDNNGEMGYVKRHGMASMWKAYYEIFDSNEKLLYTIQENNGFVKVFDTMFSQIPVIGILTGLFFNPSYSIRDLSGKTLYTLSKLPTLFSREFRLNDESLDTIDNPELVFCCLIQMLCLERDRG